MKAILRKSPDKRYQATSFILILSLIASLLLGPYLKPLESYADTASDQVTANASLSEAVGYYSSSSGQDKILSHWEELLAIYSASLLSGTTFSSIQLEEWALPASPDTDLTSPKTYSSYVITELIKGYAPSTQVQELINSATKGALFSNDPIDQAMAMVALEVASMSGINVDNYQPIDAATHLVSLQKNDGGYQSMWDPRSNIDTSGYVAIALAPYSNLPAVQKSVSSLVDYFQKEQLSNGGFPYYWAFGASSGSYESANSTALAVWGLSSLIAHAVDPEIVVSAAALESKALPALTKYQNGDGSFGFDETGNGFFDSSTSRQVMIALSNIASGNSIFDRIVLRNNHIRTVSVQIDTTASALAAEPSITVTSAATSVEAIDAINSALFNAGKQEAQVSGTEILTVDGIHASEGQAWRLYVNGTVKTPDAEVFDGDQITLFLAAEGDRIYRTAFDHPIVTTPMGETFSLKLAGRQLGTDGAANTPMEGATILVNGSTYDGYPYKTAANGSINLSFLTAGTYEISAQLYGTVTQGGIYAKTTITHPICKVIVASGQGYSRTVDIRVEGISQSGIISTPSAIQRNFTATTNSSKLLTAEDALKQMLDSQQIAYEIDQGYILSIGGKSNAPYPAWYPSWMYLVNGVSPSVGIGNYVLQGNEEIIVYYANSETVYPIVEQDQLEDGSLKITISADVMNWSTWQSVKTPIAGVGVIWDGSLVGTTDANGQLSVVPNQATVGYHSLQLDKHDASGVAIVLPLASDYQVKIAEGNILTSSNSTVDLVGVPDSSPQSISYGSNVTVPKVIVATASGVELPEITATNSSNTMSLTVPQGTKISSSSPSWDGSILLPIPNTSTIDGKTVHQAMTVGSPGNTLTFDKPVRILLPGVAGKTVAYLDNSGTIVNINPVITADTVTAAAASLISANKLDGTITIGNDVVIWTKHFTTFLAYSNAGSGAPVNNTITISVTGYQGQSMLASRSITLTSGMTALSALNGTGLDVKVKAGAGYVESINDLSEFDHGVESGWKYTVNGDYPSISAGNYPLQTGDVVRWIYVTKINEGESLLTQPVVTGSITSIDAKVDTTGNVEALLTNEELKTALKDGTYLQITSDVASIKFDQSALTKISSQISGDLTVTMIKADTIKLSEADKLLIGSRPAFEFTVKSGNTTISEFSGKVSVSIGYELAAGEDPNSILIYYINKDGKLELVKNSRYNETTKRVEFSTDHFSSYAVGYHPVSFQDTKTHWAKDSINFLAARGIIKGITRDTFQPGKTVSRAEFITILANKAGVDLTAYQSTGQNYVDVKSSDWFAKAVAWASEQGVVNGSQNKDGMLKFDPNANITRQDMAVILSRYLAKLEKTTLATPNVPVTFADQDKIASYASFAVKNMQQAGILNGKTATTFAPADSATRAEAGKTIAEMMKVTL